MSLFFKAPRSLAKALAGLAFAALLGAPVLAPPALAQAQLALTGYGSVRSLALELNKSMIIDLPADVGEVIVSQPDVVGAIMRTTRRAIIQGVGAGDTNIFFLDAAGRAIAILDISVSKEPSQIGSALETAIARIVPGSAVKVESVTLGGNTNRVVLSGTVQSGDDSDRAMQIAAQFAGSAENVANLITVRGGQQVMLEVVVSEIKRDVARQLGINLSGTLSVGTANFGFNNQTTGLTNGVSAGFGIGNLTIDAALRALEERNALRLLAQPTLTAMSGQPARFLAGGEIPYATTDDDGNQTVIFKPYGIELDFTPVVKSNGAIGLTVETSVTEPQPNLTLTSRRASTTVELPVGSTLAIGGLLEDRTRQQISQLPGLGNVPILGALFRSRDYQTQQTELVILVTPYLVEGTYAQPILPTDRSQVPTDAEAFFLGHLEKVYGVGSGGGMRGSLSGSVGFVLD